MHQGAGTGERGTGNTWPAANLDLSAFFNACSCRAIPCNDVNGDDKSSSDKQPKRCDSSSWVSTSASDPDDMDKNLK
jgi:hypothetical protein